MVACSRRSCPIAHATARFVIDPRVRGKISLETPRPVNRAQAFALLKTVLRQQGFAIVDLGDLYKVVPEADAKLQSGPVEIGAASARDGDEVITQVFQLNHESANNMIPVLRPLVSPNNTITAFPGNNTLIITDYAANLKRLSKVIATLDSPRPAAEVQVEFLDPADDGDEGGSMFPTGNRVDDLDVPGIGTLKATMINAGIPTVFINAAEIGCTGTELREAINTDPVALARFETIRA